MRRPHPLLAIFLASLFVLVPAVAPWMHSGCDHAHDHAAGGHRDACRHHHYHGGGHHEGDHAGHRHGDEHAQGWEHRHEPPQLSSHCLACQFLLASANLVAHTSCELAERIARNEAPCDEPLAHQSGFSLYRSRAPPARS